MRVTKFKLLAKLSSMRYKLISHVLCYMFERTHYSKGMGRQSLLSKWRDLESQLILRMVTVTLDSTRVGGLFKVLEQIGKRRQQNLGPLT